MYKLIVFGTGLGCNRLKKVLDDSNTEIMAYTDNNSSKWESELDGIIIIPPNSINDLEYDFIVITSQFYTEIIHQLSSMNISTEKIINFFSAELDAFTGLPISDLCGSVAITK